MRAALLFAIVVMLGCAPSPQQSAAAQAMPQEVTIDVPVSAQQIQSLRSTGSAPLRAEFRLTGVANDAALPTGVVRIALDSDPEKTLAIVNLREPFASGDDLERTVMVDLGASLSPADLERIAERGALRLSFAVEPAEPNATPVGIEAPSARFSN